VLGTLARRSAIPVTLDLRMDSRLPVPIEVAAYYVMSEALANAAKHAQASLIDISVPHLDDEQHHNGHFARNENISWRAAFPSGNVVAER
jgi:nitrate/nitrite-specific signal transduction histidine kinase